MSRKAFLRSHSAAATTTPKNTAAGRRGPSTFRSVAAASPSLSPRDGRESGQPEFLLRFFGLKQEPFPDAPDDGFCYTNAAIRQIYRELINVLAERPGIAVLTGEAGTGKTILIRRLCSELRASGHLVIGRCRGGRLFCALFSVNSQKMKIPFTGEDRAA